MKKSLKRYEALVAQGAISKRQAVAIELYRNSPAKVIVVKGVEGASVKAENAAYLRPA